MIRDSRLSLRIGVGIAALLVLGSASVAHAQYQSPPPGYYAPPPGYGYPPPPPPPPPREYRSGLTLGGAIGGGGISASNCSACGGGFAFELHIGGMVAPQLAIMADISSVLHSYDDGLGGSNTLSNSLFAVAAQYWIAPIVWLKGGIGDAHIALSDYAGNTYGTNEDALGVLLAGGVEVFRTPIFALDLQLRFMHGSYSGGGATNYAFLVGFNWY
jgi:hypothetical protein